MVKKTYGELPEEQILSDSIIPFENGSGITKRSTPTKITYLTLHTGVIKGMVVSVNAGDDTKFDMSVGTALKVDRTDPDNVIVTTVDFPGLTAQLDTNLTEPFSNVFVDPDTQVATTEIDPPDSLSDLNDRISCGTILHTSGVISALLDNPIIAYGSSISEIAEMVLGGGVTVSGGEVTANGANLKLDVTTGVFQMYGRGRQFDTNNPNTSEIAAQVPVPVGNFIKFFEDALGVGIIDATTNDMDPTQFNDGGLGTLVTVANNQFTVFRGFYAVLPAGTTRLVTYYGTQEFSSASLALSSVEPTFKESESIIRLAPVSEIAVRQDVVDLTAALASGLAIIEQKLRRV